MSDVAQTAGKLDIGRVFGDAITMIRRQFVPLLGVVIVFAALPTVLNLALNGESMDVGQNGFGPSYWLTLLIGLIVGSYAYAVQFELAVNDLLGRDASWRHALRAALPKILPTLGLFILWGLGVFVGSALLLAPGLILMTMWAVSLPAVVNEPGGPIKAFGRSRALTKGNRWRVFGVLVLYVIGLLVIEGLMMVPIRTMQQGGSLTLATAALAIVLSTLMALMTTGLLAAMYVQLRSLKEGLGGRSAAEVFG